MSAQETTRAWHVGEWGTLAWLETALKTAGIAVGVAALIAASGHSGDGPGGVGLAQVVVLAVLCLGLVAAIADRLADRETIGLVFIVAMNVGHLAMLGALLRYGGLDGALVAFACLMLAGDLVKLVFLRTTGFTVRSVPPAAVYGLTGTYVVGYLALIALAIS